MNIKTKLKEKIYKNNSAVGVIYTLCIIKNFIHINFVRYNNLTLLLGFNHKYNKNINQSCISISIIFYEINIQIIWHNRNYNCKIK